MTFREIKDLIANASDDELRCILSNAESERMDRADRSEEARRKKEEAAD